MLLKELKKIANESCFNPKNPTKDQKIEMDVGNPLYWTTKAIECITSANTIDQGSTTYHKSIQHAIRLLILTRAYLYEKDKETKKARERNTRKSNKVIKTT